MGINVASPRKPLYINRGVRDAELRFGRSVVIGSVSDFRPDLGPCLLATTTDNGRGYALFKYDNGNANGYAHRYAWERENGPIPEDMEIDHLCRVRRCVNVNHYFRCGGCSQCQRVQHEKLNAKRRRVENGLPDRRIKYDQDGLPTPPENFPTLRRGRWVLLDAHGGMASASRPAA